MADRNDNRRSYISKKQVRVSNQGFHTQENCFRVLPDPGET